MVETKCHQRCWDCELAMILEKQRPGDPWDDQEDEDAETDEDDDGEQL